MSAPTPPVLREEAFAWLTRQLGWERTLGELRARADETANPAPAADRRAA